MSEQVFKRLYSVREAARYLGVSQWAVRHLNWSSKLPCVRQGRRVLFDIYDMDRFIENNKQEGHYGHDLSSQKIRPDDGNFGATGPILDEILR
ncbi:MAG: helix-turn-helix domain-containing protein [Nitrospira sp.]|nr:helix-turn-helix domain-containing protein [Nitrospira sp.]